MICYVLCCPFLVCRQFFQEQFLKLDEELFRPNRAAFPADAFTAERFAWAVATVRSRLRTPLDAGSLAIVPLADAVRLCGVLGPSSCVMCLVHPVVSEADVVGKRPTNQERCV